jgi:hypothetical protein
MVDHLHDQIVERLLLVVVIVNQCREGPRHLS